jgi:hypothetical protein
MKAKELAAILLQHPEADVIIHRDCQNYGFGYPDKIIPGIFELTNYGNDFWANQVVITNKAQVRAICIYPEDYIETPDASDNPGLM